MAKNVTLMGADYPAVPAVVLPQTGGGDAVFYDADSVIDMIDVGTRTYYCVCATSMNEYKRLTVNLVKPKARTVTVNSVVYINSNTERKSEFSLSNESANGLIQLYTPPSTSIPIGGLCAVNLTIS